MTTNTEPVRMTTAAQRNRRSPSIDRRRIKERDASRRDFQVQLLEGETLDGALAPEFLGHKADVLTPGDRIALIGPEFEFWAELLVVDRDENLQAVRTILLLGPVDLAPRIAAAASYDLTKIAVEQAGEVWRLRLGTRVVANGFRTKAEAMEHLDDIRRGRKAVSRA